MSTKIISMSCFPSPTSALGAVERSQGDFESVTGPFPGMGESPKGLPACGNAAMLTSQSEDPAVREAAWA